MKLNYEKFLTYVYLILFISLALFGTLFFKVNDSLEKANKWINHTHQVLFQSEQLLSSIKDLQIANRDYAITRDPSFISKFGRIERSVRFNMEELKRLTADNAVQQKRVGHLQDLVFQRLAAILEYRKSGYKGLGSKQGMSYTGEEFLHNVRDIIDQVQREEDHLLLKRNEANNSSRESLNFIFNILIICGGLLLIVSFFIASKYIHLRRKAFDTANQLNEALHKSIQQKSNEITEQEARYYMVLDNMMEGAQIIDYNWKYLYANAILAQQAKYPISKLVGSSMLNLYPGIENTPLFEALVTCMNERKHQRFENHFQYPDGTSGYYELSISPIKEGLFVLSMDITDRKRKEIDKEQYINELEKVLFKISHEVRSPVVKILGVAQLFDLSLVKEDEFPMIVNEMRNCAVLLDRYTRELSEFVAEMLDNSAREGSLRMNKKVKKW